MAKKKWVKGDKAKDAEKPAASEKAPPDMASKRKRLYDRSRK